ncbi:hypothetical protein [Streptomyces sp. B21-083]|uniref:hypothetical protein n=1 Tax=Streptomyces sp. B21-083 TaxID=3039410 RepID=UPI002FF0268B
MLLGSNIVDCGEYALDSPGCTPARLHIYPIRWNSTADGSGPGGSIRELRLHPDQVHLGFNSIAVSGSRLDQFGYLGRLRFNPAPTSGAPLVPRYDLDKATRLFDASPAAQPVHVDPNDPSKLVDNTSLPGVGEFRGFSKDGTEAFYVGYPVESSNLDLVAVNLQTGRSAGSRRTPGTRTPWTPPPTTGGSWRWTPAATTA